MEPTWTPGRIVPEVSPLGAYLAAAAGATSPPGRPTISAPSNTNRDRTPRIRGRRSTGIIGRALGTCRTGSVELATVRELYRAVVRRGTHRACFARAFHLTFFCQAMRPAFARGPPAR